MRVILAGLTVLLGACDLAFCGAAPGGTEASLYVSDATNGAAIARPELSEKGQKLTASCGAPDSETSTCTYQLVALDPGEHEITIAAEGYDSQTVKVDTSTVDSVHLAVALRAAKVATEVRSSAE